MALARVGFTAALLTLVTVTSTACGDFPRDAHGSLDNIKSRRTVRVGWTGADPWIGQQAPGGAARNEGRRFQNDGS